MTVSINGVEQPTYTDAEALAAAIAGGLSKVIWKDTSVTVMSDNDRTVDLAWTDLDLSAVTSNKAKFAILNLRLKPPIIGSGNYCQLSVRKNGTTASYPPSLFIYKVGLIANFFQEQEVIVGLDDSQELEYEIDVGVDWTLDSRIRLLGYIE
ncbi:hypothetical protein ES707_03676 [subsurface metagenome]